MSGRPHRELSRSSDPADYDNLFLWKNIVALDRAAADFKPLAAWDVKLLRNGVFLSLNDEGPPEQRAAGVQLIRSYLATL